MRELEENAFAFLLPARCFDQIAILVSVFWISQYMQQKIKTGLISNYLLKEFPI
jgi:hypothetical protein